MRLPDFLVVGAMKAGTTSLYRDLLAHPDVYFPIDKEPHSLTDDSVLTASGRAAYAALFRRARPDQRCGEASTGYTKLPDIAGVPARARRLLGPDLKVVYLVRNPVTRTLSHHFHDASVGRVPLDVDRAVVECKRLIDYSRYAMQVEPWLDEFGPANVRVVLFEEFVARRRETVAGVCEFLRLTPLTDGIREDVIYNKGEDRRAVRGWSGRLQQSLAYRRLIRPLIPIRLRDALRDALLPPVGPRPAAPHRSTIDFIIDQVRDDVRRLADILNRRDEPWDFEVTRSQFS